MSEPSILELAQRLLHVMLTSDAPPNSGRLAINLASEVRRAGWEPKSDG